MMFSIEYHRKTKKDLKNLKAKGLAENAKTLMEVLKKNPFQNAPPYEKLTGNLSGFYSRRINITHRLVYEVNEVEKVVRVLSMWSHYGE